MQERVVLLDKILESIANPNKAVKVLDETQVSFDFLVKLQYQLRTILKENDVRGIRVILDTSSRVYSITEEDPNKSKLILLYTLQKGDVQ